MRIRIVMYYKYCKYKYYMAMEMAVFIPHYGGVEVVTVHLNLSESELGFCVDSNQAHGLPVFDMMRVY